MNTDKMIFVFGSNEAGIHGAGAARTALLEHGAVYGQGFGHFGHSFAVPTKCFLIKPLSLMTISKYIHKFLEYTYAHPELKFQVTQLGCGLAGNNAADIAPMFIGGHFNIWYDAEWKDFLTDDSKFWGTYR